MNSTFKALSELPSMDSKLIRTPDHLVNPFPGTSRTPAHRFTLLHGESRWLWAHALRAVSGWKVISAGVLSLSLYPTADDAGEYLVRQFLGPNGDGIDRLTHEAFSQIGRTAHIRNESAPATTYCGKPNGAPAVFDTSEPRHAEQHCIACDQEYRALHYGRMAVTY